ncbi:MAG: Ig-like domain-containing protein [Candidatus Bathyarchaeota archaeon]|nr:Ig-like domain-containing protein [Candidatus Bathyarchaeota archaeon]
MTTPKILKTSPQDHSQDIQVDSQVQIDFLIPVNRDLLIPSIEPEIPGEWKYRKPILKEHLYRSLVFIPEQILKPETTYKIKLKDIQGIVSLRKPYNFEFSFSTQPLPRVIKVEPENGAKEILPFSQIKVKLSHPNPKLVDLEFISEPKTEFNIKLNNDKDEYTLVPKEDLLQGVKYQFYIKSTFRILDKETNKIIFQDEPKELYRGTFETAPPPKILSFSPTGSNILIDDNIEISLTESMLRESVEKNFSINPSIEGAFTWSENNKNLIFNPSQALPYGTSFKVILKKGTKDEEGKYFPKDIIFSFKTIGRVWASLTPSNGSKGIGVNSSLKIYFDQPIDKDSAKERFKIEPKVNGSLSFSKNTMIFDPYQPLAYQTTYKATILSGVKSIYGLDSNRTFSTSFSTQYQTFKLPVPLDFQDYPLSCEAAALKMALRYKGIGASENQIMNYVGIDSSPRQGNIWGDPYNIYVGSLNGRQNTTGYGVYWGPIARAAKVWRPASKSFSGWGVSDLTKELKSGNPIVVWGVIGAGAYQDSWSTQDGKYIYAWKGEHARVVIGFIGSSASPTKFILNDPYVGQIYWSTSSFLSNWNIFNRSGVVVR